MRKLGAAVIVLITAGLAGCGYNDIQRNDEQVKSAWSEVLNQYQRRADLIPNLVNTVKGFTAQEQQVLIQVTEARSRVGSIQATPELLNDEAALRSSGVAWMLPTRERASVTWISTCCSCAVNPLTVLTRLGIRSARR